MLSDPFGTKRHINIKTKVGDHTLHEGRHTREKSRTQNENLTVTEELLRIAQRRRNRVRVRIEVLINRSSNDNDHMRRSGHDRGVRRRNKHPIAQSLLQLDTSIGLSKRHHARVDHVHRCGIDVINRDPRPPVRKTNRKRQTHMATATNDNDVTIKT